MDDGVGTVVDVFQNKELLQEVLTATTDAVMVIDRNWVTVYMNEPTLELPVTEEGIAASHG